MVISPLGCIYLNSGNHLKLETSLSNLRDTLRNIIELMQELIWDSCNYSFSFDLNAFILFCVGSSPFLSLPKQSELLYPQQIYHKAFKCEDLNIWLCINVSVTQLKELGTEIVHVLLENQQTIPRPACNYLAFFYFILMPIPWNMSKDFGEVIVHLFFFQFELSEFCCVYPAVGWIIVLV